MLSRKRNVTLRLIPLLILYLSVPATLLATPEFSRDTGQSCTYCHKEAEGGPLTATGEAFVLNDYHYPIPDELRAIAGSRDTFFHRLLGFVLGYLHLCAAVVLGGTIFYVHLFIGPTQLRTGIPRGERLLGLSCLATLGSTGIYLTLQRIGHVGQFVSSTFGTVLLIKILLFTVMLVCGIAAVTVVHGKMKRTSGRTPVEQPDGSYVTAETLPSFDGSKGRPAYILYQGRIYDVTGNPKWKEGKHFGRHVAGSDLTNAMAGAPHSQDVLDRIKLHGPMTIAGDSSRPSSVHRVFVVMAYANMILFFLILACVAVWTWGLPVP